VVHLSETKKLSQHKIAKRIGISKTTVNEILKHHRAAEPETSEAGGKPLR
jgi:predicted DNA-binding protein (UPF0251 family)